MANKIKCFETVSSVRQEVNKLRLAGKRIGFVPTMGFLHPGHISLVELSRRYTDHTIVSIFVNPTQFNDPKDLEAYPRDIPRDLAMLEQAGATAVFLPTPAMIYGTNFESWIALDKLPQLHEGAFRPGHFKGVSTVVGILFNIVQPDVAIFGEKDFQQLRLIEKMVDDLKYPLQIVRAPLIRESDGLAMSSRNVRLSPEARVAALEISQGLFEAHKAFKAGECNAQKLCNYVVKRLSRQDVKIDYVHLVEDQGLQEVSEVTCKSRILVAAFVGGVRLIDNIELNKSTGN